MMDKAETVTEKHDMVVEVTTRDSTLVIDINSCTPRVSIHSAEDKAVLETAQTLLGMASKSIVNMSATTPKSKPDGALDLSVHAPKATPRTVKEEHLPRKKRRIDEVLESPTNDSENCPPSAKMVKREGDKKEGKPEASLVNSFVAKALKIWYDEGEDMEKNKEEPKDLTCKEEMPKTDSFVSSYPPGCPRPDDAHSHPTEPSSYPFMKLKAMLRKKYANSLNEYSGDESLHSPVSQPSPPLPLQENLQNGQDFDPRMSVIESKNGEKLYRCNVCFKAFTFATNLTRHQRNIHGKPHRRRTKDMIDKRMERRDSTGSDVSRPCTPDYHVTEPSEHSHSNRSTPVSYLARPICSQCDMEFDNDDQLEQHNCDMPRPLSASSFTTPMTFIQELTAKIESAVHPSKSRCEDLMDDRRASFAGLNSFPLPVDRRLSMETGLIPPRKVPFENETKFQIVLNESSSNASSSAKSLDTSDSERVPSPMPGPTEDMWRFKCIECKVAFPTSKHLSKHLKIVHKVSIKEDTPKDSTGMEYSCRECGKTFSQHAYLRRHMRNIHMKPQAQQVELPTLPPQAPSPNSLNVVRSAGNLLIPGLTTIFCHLCGQTFTHPVHHYMHMAMSHGLMLQPDKDPRFLAPADKDPRFRSPIDTTPTSNAHSAEPREADTAETRQVIGNLPTPLLPGGLIPMLPGYPFMKEKLTTPPSSHIKEEKRPLLEDRRYSDNGLDLTKDKPKDRVRDVPTSLGEFILKKVVQEAKTPENSPKDFTKRSFEDYGKENQENTMYSHNMENIQCRNNSPSLSAEKMMFPSHSDGKRHICGLCGASFTFQTNLTRHQRKLHGKPFVRRPSASQIFKQENNI